MSNLNQVRSEEPAQYDVSRRYSYNSMEEVVQAAKIYVAQQLQQTGEVLNSPTKVKDYFILNDDSSDREVFKILWLNNQMEMIACEVLSTGTINQAAVYPREVVKSAIRHEAAACIISHNHPSGSLEVSRSDEEITKHLKEALGLIDVRLVDHIVTAKGESYSFAENGLI